MSLRQLITHSVNYSQVADIDQIEIDNILSYADNEQLAQNEKNVLISVLETLRN